jgi:acyl carrier protein phosphodiesterase
VNFLAHLYLAEPTPASWIGNLLPDLTTGPTDPDLHPDVLAGAANHRRVDAYTDTHTVFARTRARFREKHGRYSGILADLFYDHALARDWDRYHPQPLNDFIDQVHTAFTDHAQLMPEPMRPIIGRLIDQGWLRCYATPHGMQTVLGMMSARFTQRLQRPVDLACAVQDLHTIGESLDEDFAEFFPQLIAYTRQNTFQSLPAGD